MNKPAKLTIERRSSGAVVRTSKEIAELRAVRQRFQQEKPTLEQVLAATGQKEAMPLGEYLHVQELFHCLQLERKRQRVSLGELARRTSFDTATLSRLLTGRQTNTTLGVMERIANGLGKEVVFFLRTPPPSSSECALEH